MGDSMGIDLREAAARSGRTVQQLRRMIRAGDLPAVKHGRKLYVRPEDIDRLNGPTPSPGDSAQEAVRSWPQFSDERKQELGRLLNGGGGVSPVERPARRAPSAGRKSFPPDTETAVQQLVDSAPRLSAEQRERLRDVLFGGREPSTSLLDSLIHPDTLAKLLGTKRRTVDEWRITGKGPAYIRVGKSVRYAPEAVDAWLRSQQRGSTSEER